MGYTTHSHLGHLGGCSNLGGDTAQNSKMFEKQGGDTAHSISGYLVRCSNKGGDTAQNSKMFEKQGGTPHIQFQDIWSDVQTKVGTLHRCLRSRGGTPHIPIEGIWLEQESPYGRWAGGRFFQEILPLRGSILQAGTCQILSLAENPRWSRVWQ